jgi:hypothetical protein
MATEKELGSFLLNQVLADVYALIPDAIKLEKCLGDSLGREIATYHYKNEAELRQDERYPLNAACAIYEVLLVIQQNSLLQASLNRFLLFNPFKAKNLHGHFKSLDDLYYKVVLQDVGGERVAVEIAKVSEDRWDVRSLLEEHRADQFSVTEVLGSNAITLLWGGQKVTVDRGSSWLLRIVNEETLSLGLALFQFLHQLKKWGINLSYLPC